LTQVSDSWFSFTISQEERVVKNNMAKVVLDMSMSLDGFIAGPNDDDAGLHDWFFQDFGAQTGKSREVIDEGIKTTGAIVMGRRTYDQGDRQDGFVDTPYHVVHFVLSQEVPEKVAKGSTTFLFVTDGIENALTQAKAAAGDKDVVVGGGADIAQQYIKAGLLDEIQIHLVPVLLGEGRRLFDHLGTEHIELERTRVIESPGVTHLWFRVVK
jgi:dihydrofolate reductase